MKLLISLAAALMPLAVLASEAPTPLSQWQEDPTVILPAGELKLEEFQWVARPVVIFADNPADPRFAEQLDLLTRDFDLLVDRDVVVIVDTNPADRSALRTELRPRGFMIALVAKDGRVNLRKPRPWSVRELSRAIDKMPLRQDEIGRAK
ncbi:hypothetical protein ACMU_06040 [Actibacterium mucosum KCTC 23349]|uniref:DUF4174 domain-containing protein n=1 Tax=Actibacterium mucosum KCTC 23349 TaxID=1454373 RepID=A0A037ZJA0_9RHOB|nr:DUF4174 domain-containing protein [Actibacterium mucosum]KAJ56500.1 hypothetical protein ACMU_06040 [Actibacterium mucosum KCTC 23349]